MEQFNLFSMFGQAQVVEQPSAKKEEKKEEKKAEKKSTSSKSNAKGAKLAKNLKISLPVRMVGDNFNFELTEINGTTDVSLQDIVCHMANSLDIPQVKMEQMRYEYKDEEKVVMFSFKETDSNLNIVGWPVKVCFGRETVEYSEADFEGDVKVVDLVTKFGSDKGIPFNQACYDPKAKVIGIKCHAIKGDDISKDETSLDIIVNGEKETITGKDTEDIKKKVFASSLVKSGDDIYSTFSLSYKETDLYKADVSEWVLDANAKSSSETIIHLPTDLVFVTLGDAAWKVTPEMLGKSKVTASEMTEFIVKNENSPVKNTFSDVLNENSNLSYKVGKDESLLGKTFVYAKLQKLG